MKTSHCTLPLLQVSPRKNQESSISKNARIYGLNTVAHAKKCKHMERCFEGFLTLGTSALKPIEKLNTTVAQAQKTVVSLDVQLYS